MRTLQALDIGSDASAPLFVRIGRAIIQDIQRGRLRKGTRLPGTRSLAAQLGVNRNTVVAAFDDLALQGWIRLEPSRGAVVADDLPDFKNPPPSDTKTDPQLRVVTRAKPTLIFSDGTPDARLLPVAELSRAFRRALQSKAFLNPQGYGDPQGSLRLRIGLAELLAGTRGLAVGPDEILLTRGTQMGLFLAAHAIATDDSSAIAVESPGYPFAWDAFRTAGARVIGTPVDREGINVDALQHLAAGDRSVRGVLVTPHHQYPTTVTLGAGRRLALLTAAIEFGLTIIEDDYDHDYRYEHRPILPLAASTAAEATGSVIYLGSLSKLLAPSLRLGYAVASPHIIARMVKAREAVDRQGDVALELAVAELIEDGELARQARRARKVYLERRDLLVTLLRRDLGGALSFAPPAGGLAIWATIAPEINAERWAERAFDQGLQVTPGSRFMCDCPDAPNAFRLGFATMNASEMERAVRVLFHTMPT